MGNLHQLIGQNKIQITLGSMYNIFTCQCQYNNTHINQKKILIQNLIILEHFHTILHSAAHIFHSSTSRNFSVLLYVKILYTLGHLIRATSTSGYLKQPKWLNWLRRMTVKVRMHGSNPVSPFFYFINFTAKVCTNYVRRYVNFSY